MSDPHDLRTLQQIEADIEHLRFIMACIEDTLQLRAEDMQLRRALRWAIARKRRIAERLRAGAVSGDTGIELRRAS